MQNQRLKNQAAFLMAQHCVELLINVLDEEQMRQARQGFYEICVAGLEIYCIHSDRMQQRLRPLQN